MTRRPLTKKDDLSRPKTTVGLGTRLTQRGVVLLALGFSVPAKAFTLGYAGRVTDEAGAPLPGPVEIKVRFFGSLSGSDELSAPLALGQIPLLDGVFQLQLNLDGNQTTQIFGDGTKQVFIEIEAAGVTYPRQRFLAVPYALRVPVDQNTLVYGSDGNLTVDHVPMERVTGLASALSGKATTTDLTSKAPLVHAHEMADINGLTAALAGKADVGSAFPGINLPLAVNQGGTGGTTQATARSGIGAAASGANNDITSLGGLTTALSVAQGGTGATTLPANNVLLGNGTSTPSGVAPGASGNVLLSNGTTWTSGAIPWAAPGSIGSTTPGSGAFTTLSTNAQIGHELKPYSLAAGSTGEVRFNALTGSNYVGFKAPDTITSPKVWTLPAADGTDGQVLKTNGTGVLSWIPIPSAPVASVAGKTGAVTLAMSDISGTLDVTKGGTGGTTQATARSGLGAAASGANSDITSLAGLTTALSVTQGGTGASSLTNNGVLVGAGSLPVATISGSQYQVLQAGAGGSPTFGALNLAQTAAVTGALPLANGGTGGTTQATARSGLGAAASGANNDITSLAGLTTALSVAQGGTGATTLPANNVLLGNGISAPAAVAPGTGGNVLLSNGTTWTSGAIPWAAPGSIGSTTPASGAFTTLSTNAQIGHELKPYSLTAGSTGEVRFNALTGSNYVGFKAPDTITSPKIWTLPAADGTDGQVLKTNGTGVLSWIPIPSAPVTSVAGKTGAVTLAMSDISGTLDVTKGGTGGTTQATARSGIGAAASGANNDITSLAGLTTALSVTQGGTGASSLTNNGVLVGAGSLPVATISGSQYQVLQAGAGGSPTFGALNLAQTAAITGALPLANGGTGGTTQATARSGIGAAASGANNDITSLGGLTTALSVAQGGTGATTLPANNVLLGNGTSAPSAVAPGTGGNVLLSNGTTWTSGAIPWAAPGSIGSTTPGSGAFTTLSTNAQIGHELKPYSLAAGSTGEVRFNALTGSNYVGFKAPDTITSPKIWTLPAADGTDGQVLKTNGTGVLSWIPIPSAPVTSVAGKTGAVTLAMSDISGTLDVTKGGTGGTTQATARSGIGAAAAGANSDITSLGGLTTALSVTQGGTGASSLTNNGVLVGAGSLPVATISGSQYQVLQAGAGGSPAFGALNLTQTAAITGALPLANGGTGGTTQATARSGIGAAASGANSDITSLAGLTTALSVAQGGTGANLSATGGTGRFLKQTSAGGAVSVGTISASELPVMVASGASNSAGIVPAPGTTEGITRYLREDATWAVPSGGGAVTWNTVTTTSVTAAAGNGYAINHANRVTVTLPGSCTLGDQITVIAVGAGGWALSSTLTMVGPLATSLTSPLNSIAAGQVAQITCIQANTSWKVVFPEGPDAPTANLPAYSGYNDTAYSGSVSGSSPFGKTLTYFCVTCPAGLNVISDTGAVSWTPQLTHLGRNFITIGVSDGIRIGYTTAAFNIFLNTMAAGSYSLAVPSGVTSLTLKAWGAGGGGASSVGTGGAGGYSGGPVTVTPGETLSVRVGSGGFTDSCYSTIVGYGGGFTGIYRGSTIIFAAGSGGGGSTNGSGGTGGGASGSSGSGSMAGGGGTQTAGGAGGIGSSFTGVPGSYGSGGSQFPPGGAGYYGGGGAGYNSSSCGSSGGGSSYGGSTMTAGSGTTPGNSGDVDRNGAGQGGALNTAGANGRIKLSW